MHHLPPVEHALSNSVPMSYDGGYFAGQKHIMADGMIAGISAHRVAIPAEEAIYEEPLYVNAKQYHRILKRRQQRAKLEAENRTVKDRRPYLHESRHKHARNRVRGNNGRFLTAKERADLQATPEDAAAILAEDAITNPDSLSGPTVPDTVDIIESSSSVLDVSKSKTSRAIDK